MRQMLHFFVFKFFKFAEAFSVFKVKVSFTKSLVPIFTGRAFTKSRTNHFSSVFFQLGLDAAPNLLLIRGHRVHISILKVMLPASLVDTVIYS